MTTKSYLDLRREIWETGRCSGCGACVAVCPADALRFEEGGTCPVNSGYCKEAIDEVGCGACYDSCPRTGEQGAAGLGQYLTIVSGKATFAVPGRQSGGAVTAILANALDEGLIDAVVTVTEDRWTLRPSSAVITASDVLVHQAGSRYAWWVPLLASLKHAVIERRLRRIAIVGLPCAVQAIARIRRSNNDLLRPYAAAIRCTIGLFCTEAFDYNALVRGILPGQHGLEPFEIRKLDVKGKLEITRHDGGTVHIPLGELERCIRPGCRYCTDLTSVYADISAGSVGSPAGSTTLIVRTRTGKGFLDSAVRNKKLAVAEGVGVAAIEKLATAKARKNQDA